jgi:hypothetical protein
MTPTYKPHKSHLIENIKVIDDFFSEDLITKIVDYYKKVEWECKSITRPNADIETDVPFWRHELFENEYYYAAIITAGNNICIFLILSL